MSLEQRFMETDFSRFSKVKESLQARLHEERKNILIPGRLELEPEELDYVAAAGTGQIPKESPKAKDLPEQ